MLIGSRLRLLRQQRGLSLREVSEQTGFSASFLSLLENDKVSPSVASMERIAAAFGLSLAEYFQHVQERPYQLVRAGERQNYTSEWSQTMVELLARQGQGGALYPLLLRLSPGARSGKTPRPTMTEEFTLVLNGEVVLSLAEGEQTLFMGDSISIAAGTARAWENRSEAEAVLLVVGHRSPPPETRSVER